MHGILSFVHFVLGTGCARHAGGMSDPEEVERRRLRTTAARMSAPTRKVTQ
jgi:hypothetical protein